MDAVTRFDVFNGDADGICALIQLRCAEPLESHLVTGVKRDIRLLDRVKAGAGDKITVLDVSLDQNRLSLERLLDVGAEVFYIDHHFAGELPQSRGFSSIIDPAPEVCTSLLVNRHLAGAFATWAIVGAYGDNLKVAAQTLAESEGLNRAQQAVLEKLGIYINYNGYGAAIDDLHFDPAELYRRMSPYSWAFEFVTAGREDFVRLEDGYRSDMSMAANLRALQSDESIGVFMLPNEPWARRASGVFSNDLVNRYPSRAHAVVTENADGLYLVSVRAPLDNRVGADELCRRFPTGGGRAAAAGINELPGAQLDEFIKQFKAAFKH